VLNQTRQMLKNEVSIIMLASDMSSEGAAGAAVERCIVEGADSYILKPAALKELTALWGFVARRRQHAMETSNLHDLNQVIRSVEDEIGTQQRKSRSSAQLVAHHAESRAAAAATHDGTCASSQAADAKPEPATKVVPMKSKSPEDKRRVRWSMHEQFEEDLKADLADAQKRDLPEHGIGLNSAIFNPALEACVGTCVTSLLGILHPEKNELRTSKKGGSSDSLALPAAVSSGLAKDTADTESDTSSFGPRENKNGLLAIKPKLRKGDSGNLRAMLLERRQHSTGRSSQELLTMISILDGNEDDDDQPDELVLCRLCEQQVLRSSLQLHTAVCRATHKAQNDDNRANKEVRELLNLLTSTRRQALLSLMTIAVQRFNLLCAPLDKLNELGLQLLQNEDAERSPLHHLGRLTELARDLAQLKRAGGSELGGSVFYSCASQLKAIIADKIGNVQVVPPALAPLALDSTTVGMPFQIPSQEPPLLCGAGADRPRPARPRPRRNSAAQARHLLHGQAWHQGLYHDTDAGIWRLRAGVASEKEVDRRRDGHQGYAQGAPARH